MAKLFQINPFVLLILLGAIGILLYEIIRIARWSYKEVIEKDEEGADKIIEGKNKWISWAVALIILAFCFLYKYLFLD